MPHILAGSVRRKTCFPQWRFPIDLTDVQVPLHPSVRGLDIARVDNEITYTRKLRNDNEIILKSIQIAIQVETEYNNIY